jgi:hypothetical protein
MVGDGGEHRIRDALSGGRDGNGRQDSGHEGTAVHCRHDHLPIGCECTEPGGKPFRFLLGIVSVMTRLAPVLCGKSPLGVSKQRVGALNMPPALGFPSRSSPVANRLWL